ncbi:unnamed protein product, partial [Meganyctiphanes norvegica]
MSEDPSTENSNSPENEAEKPETSRFSKTVIRMATIILYVSGISGPGFLGSVFYLFIWESGIQGVRPPGHFKQDPYKGEPLIYAQPYVMKDVPFAEKYIDDTFAPNHVPVRRKMSNAFVNTYLRNHVRSEAQPHKRVSQVPDGSSYFPEVSNAMPSSEQPEFQNKESNVKPPSNSPHNAMESKIN